MDVEHRWMFWTAALGWARHRGSCDPRSTSTGDGQSLNPGIRLLMLNSGKEATLLLLKL